MIYDPDTFSYGVELEYGNCDMRTILPRGAKWNHLDNTCVSTTGIANDPLGKVYQFGGEINTSPTYTIPEQVSHIQDINNSLSDKVVNYRSNLHIHIRVPELHNNLEDCKNLLRYVNTYQGEAFGIVETIPIPDKRNLPKHIYEWELIRYKRRLKSHQFKLPQNRVKEMLSAKTTKEFYEEHAPLTDKGRMWYFSPRAGINLRQMWEETNTIEFRHFPGTLNMEEMESSIRWCREFLATALNNPDISPREIQGSFKFPQFAKYEYETEQCYQYTNFDKNNRGKVTSRLTQLRNYIDIDTMETKSVDTFKIIQDITQ